MNEKISKKNKFKVMDILEMVWRCVVDFLEMFRRYERFCRRRAHALAVNI